MNDKDFARIKARFPALRWRRSQTYRVVATFDAYEVVVSSPLSTDSGYEFTLDTLRDGYCFPLASRSSRTLGRCLRSLECAIRREAETLAGMVGLGGGAVKTPDLVTSAREWAAAKAAADAHRKSPKPVAAHYWTCAPGPDIRSDHWVRYENCPVCVADADEAAVWARAQRRLSNVVRRAERQLLRAIAEAR